MARLPTVGGDAGNWGDILNDYLSQSHNADGSLKTDSVGAPQLRPSSVTTVAIGDGQVTNSKVADAAVGTNQLSDGAVTNAKLAGAGAANGVATLDGDAKLTDAQVPDRLTQAALTSQLVERDQRRARTDIAFLGDSITSWQSATSQAWHYQLCGRTGGILRHRGAFATGGFDLFQIRDTHLPSVLALTPLPGRVVVAGGTNDTGSTNTPYVKANSQAALLEIYDALEAAGIEPVGWLIPPRDDSTTVNGYVQGWNAWVRAVCQARGYAVVDAYGALVDDTTGLYRTTLKLDSTHPNLAGHQSIAEHVAADATFLAHFTGTAAYLTSSILDSNSMMSAKRGLFLDGMDGGGRPNGWAEYTAGSHVGTMVTDPLVPGNWWEISRAAGSGAGGGYQYDITTGFSVGDKIYLALRYDVVADPLNAGFYLDTTLQALNASNTVLTTGKMCQIGATQSGIVTTRLTLPANTAKIRVNLAVGGTGTIDSRARVAQVTVMNLTTLGVDL